MVAMVVYSCGTQRWLNEMWEVGGVVGEKVACSDSKIIDREARQKSDVN